MTDDLDLFIVGPVHGCFHTFEKLVTENWRPGSEILIQLGDLIDRGKFSHQVLDYAIALQAEHGSHVQFLKGNHEQECHQHFLGAPKYNWLKYCGDFTLRTFAEANLSIQNYLDWMGALPLFWENEHIHASHAGISSGAKDPWDEYSDSGLLWHRSKLRNITKLQVVGHTPTSDLKATFDSDSNAWYIDTGACYGGALTGIRVTSTGEAKTIVQVPALVEDLAS